MHSYYTRKSKENKLKSLQLFNVKNATREIFSSPIQRLKKRKTCLLDRKRSIINSRGGKENCSVRTPNGKNTANKYRIDFMCCSPRSPNIQMFIEPSKKNARTKRRCKRESNNAADVLRTKIKAWNAPINHQSVSSTKKLQNHSIRCDPCTSTSFKQSKECSRVGISKINTSKKIISKVVLVLLLLFSVLYLMTITNVLLIIESGSPNTSVIKIGNKISSEQLKLNLSKCKGCMQATPKYVMSEYHPLFCRNRYSQKIKKMSSNSHSIPMKMDKGVENHTSRIQIVNELLQKKNHVGVIYNVNLT